MSNEIIDLPIIVCGRRVHARGSQTFTPLTCENGSQIRIPRLSTEHVSEMEAQDTQALASLHVQEIIALLNRVGNQWKSREYVRRQLYVNYMVELFGYSEKMADTEANWIALMLCSHWRMYDLLAAELGSRHIMDVWVPREECYVKAIPRGRIVHVLAGNVPMGGIASLIRGLITKNTNIIKLPLSDLVTALFVAQTFIELEPKHPVTKSLSVFYYPKGDPVENSVFNFADVLCVWGGDSAVGGVRSKLPRRAHLVEFGPKRSIAMIGQDLADPQKVGNDLAHDICVYNQRACFSPQFVFVEGDVDRLVRHLAAGLERYRDLLPKGKSSFDTQSAITRARLENTFLEHEVITPQDDNWTIIVQEFPELLDHPLQRVVYVYPIKSLEEACEWVTPEVQTVSLSPWDLQERLRDRLAARGAARITEVGMSNIFRIGTAHDSIYPLSQFVRVVSLENPSSVHGKGMVLDIDQTKFLEFDRFAEFIP